MKKKKCEWDFAPDLGVINAFVIANFLSKIKHIIFSK